MDVLVYSGPDVALPALTHTLAALRTLLVPHYAVQTITSQPLSSHPWSASCALLVLPPFTASGSGSSTGSGAALTAAASKGIQNYVAEGGRLLSLGTPARAHARRARDPLSLSARIGGISLADAGLPGPSVGSAKVTLEDGDSGLSFSLVSPHDTQADERDGTAVAVQLTDGSRIDGVARAGGVDLSEVPDAAAKGVVVLARFDTTGDVEDRSPAGVRVRVGRGSAVFWGIHFRSSSTTGVEMNAGQLRALRQSLEDLGLRLPSQHSESESERPARPTPQVLSSSPWRTGVVEKILGALGVSELGATASTPYELKDSNDTFLLHPSADAARIFREQVEAAKTASDDPATWNPKHIVTYTDGAVPSRDLTPRFDIATYYEELKNARSEHGCPEGYAEDVWGIGEALLYGEIVTSTQTMLDKNNRLLTTLPTPLLSLASAQLTGRGRGANVWLSPPGCLQFSLLLRAPLSALPAPRIVFVQYLFALAVAEACRADGVLGPGADAGERVRIKWPNDLYAETRDGGRRKIGGILVNTSFGAGKVELVIGCGLNVLNPPPIPSLAQLLPGPAGEGAPARALPTMERTAATIMARFERMWTEFIRARGSFAPFMDLYLDRWLHSDQLVTLTTGSPPRKVRIVGITPEHGLLRTLPEPEPRRSAWSGTGGTRVEYIDLQPDGNSFDLMAGLIKTKT